ncbi:MAG: WG repeat-containing protein [Pirellulaceae bacterium]
MWNPPLGIVPHEKLSEGLLVVSELGLFGFADRKGTVKIQPIYEAALPYTDGLACVLLNGKWGFIDRGGNMVIKPQFHAPAAFVNGVALVGDHKTDTSRFINRKGVTLVPRIPIDAS